MERWRGKTQGWGRERGGRELDKDSGLKMGTTKEESERFGDRQGRRVKMP